MKLVNATGCGRRQLPKLFITVVLDIPFVVPRCTVSARQFIRCYMLVERRTARDHHAPPFTYSLYSARAANNECLVRKNI